MSTALLKALRFGEVVSLPSLANVFHLYEEWKPFIHAEKFRPLIPLTGGMSFLTNTDENDRSFDALLFSEDWLRGCRALGVGTKNAVTCLAANFDEEIGIVAMALEIAMISTKEKTSEDIRLETSAYLDVVTEIFVKNYADILVMADTWGVTLKEGLQTEPKKTRSDWRKELGYDVLIHPATLEPCRGEDGLFLKYEGIVELIMSEHRYGFMFHCQTTGTTIVDDTFPKVS